MKYPGHIVEAGEPSAVLVRAVAAQLAALGYRPSSPDGVFDDAFTSVVKTFQSQHGDAAGRPLRPDGKIGPLTWGSLFGGQPAAAVGLAGAALARARTQIGVMEHPLGSNSGPQVDAYLASVNTAPGNAWCMAFVYFCFKEGASDAGLPNLFPQTAGVIDAWNRAKAALPNRVVTADEARADPSLVKPGFVFILDFGGGHGHTGFVTEQSSGALHTIEGNSNSSGGSEGVGVFALNRRSVMESDLKGFLDFTF